MRLKESALDGVSGEEEEQTLVSSYAVATEEGEATLVQHYLPKVSQMSEVVRVAHSEVAELHLSGEEEEGSTILQRYIPEGWEIGDHHGRLVHRSFYNSRSVNPPEEQ